MKRGNRKIELKLKTVAAAAVLILLALAVSVCLCACYGTEPSETDTEKAHTTDSVIFDDDSHMSEPIETPQAPLTADTEESREPVDGEDTEGESKFEPESKTESTSEPEKATEAPTEPETEPHICTFVLGYDGQHHFLLCAECGNIKDRAEHVFDNACDTSCNECGYTREISHSLEEKYDAAGHYLLCSVCGNIKDRAEHIFDNACDTSCNECGYTREISHSFEEKYDAAGHYLLCSVCGEEKNRAEHIFDNACDRTCNKCGYSRTVQHELSGWSANADRHWQMCLKCRAVFSYLKHVYDGDCDTDCNICGYVRTAPHRCDTRYCDGTYHWGVCADCGALGQKSEHTFGSDKKCTTCGFKSGQPYEVIDKLTAGGAEIGAKAKKLTSLGADGDYNVAQGACTDGKYVYIILENQNTGGEGYKKESHYCKIYKIELATCKTVKVSKPLLVDHGNDCAYNSRTGQIVICHNAPNKKRLTFVDAETLTLVKTVTSNKFNMFAVAYNANYDKYVVGIANYYDYGILTASLAYEKRISGTNTGYTKQGIDCDDKYIYLLQYKSNIISIHDWDGNYVGTIKLTNVTNEPEAIFHIGDDFYMTSYAGGKKGAVLYKLTLG